MMSRSLRAETRSRGKEEIKRSMQALEKVRKWEKKWITIHDTTMKIYKWVPVASEERKKKLFSSMKEIRLMNKENALSSSLQMTGEDSNTAMSNQSDSQGPTSFSHTSFGISEDSNPEPPLKKKLIE